MAEYSSGAYFVSRRNGKRRGPNRAAGALVLVLLLLTAGICLLVVFLPRFEDAGVSGKTNFVGKTFFFLATAREDERVRALEQAEYAVERGGAGYLYNDGEYVIIAAVYSRETDAKTLAALNADSSYFSSEIPKGEYGSGDLALITYLAGEFFDTVSAAASELDRGNISEAACEHAVGVALGKLEAKAHAADSALLREAALASAEYDIAFGRSVLSYVRFIHVRAVVNILNAIANS